MADAEFNLRDLNDQELTEQVHDDLYNGLKAEVEEATHIFLDLRLEPVVEVVVDLLGELLVVEIA